MLKIRKLHGEVARNQIFPRGNLVSEPVCKKIKENNLSGSSFVLLFSSLDAEPLVKQLLKTKSDLHK